MKFQLEIYRSNRTQWIHVVSLPIFFFAFMMFFQPAWAINPFTTESFVYDFHITMSACIIFASTLISRCMFFLCRENIKLRGYVIWCVAELIFSSFFLGLYLWLMHERITLYYAEVSFALKTLFFVLVFPYIIIALVSVCLESENIKDDSDKNMIRFKDSYNTHKITISSTSFIYAASDENYVTIFYKKGNDAVKYVLRSSMKRIEEECSTFNNFYRCHRSYIINTSYVKVIGKDTDGTMFAELKEPDGTRIPISRKYYDDLLSKL